jgi:glycosyltransferase involved in cell wall biosynthesis
VNSASLSETPGKKSILFVSALFPPRVVGGAELSTHALAKGFAAEGHRVSVFTLQEGGTPSCAVEDGIQVFRQPAALPYWPFDGTDHNIFAKLGFHVWDNYNPFAIAGFERALHEVKPDVVSTQAITGISAGVWRSAAKAGARIVHSIRDYNVICPRSTMYRNKSPCEKTCADCNILTFGKRMLSRHVDCVVSNSAYVQQKHQQAGFFPKASWSVIPPTVDLDSFSERAARTDRKIRFGFAGRISPEKGPEQLVDALSSIGIGDWECIIAGRGDQAYVNALKVRADPRISFAGWMQPADFYSAVDVVVSPALWPEPAGRTIIEAYAHGLPVIVSRFGGMSESVIEDKTGWIVDPTRIEELIVALRKSADPQFRSRLDRDLMKTILEERAITGAVSRYSKAFNLHV